MPKEKDHQKGTGESKDFTDKRTFNKPGTEKLSQHDSSDQDEKRRMGQFGGAGEHPRDTGRGNRHQ